MALKKLVIGQCLLHRLLFFTMLDYIRISKNGFSIDDDQLTVLRHVLTEFKVRTKEDAQHVVGVIQYCYSAFRWEGNQSLLEYSKLISTLTSSWKGIEGQKTHTNGLLSAMLHVLVSMS